MSHSITLNLTEEQYYVLSSMASSDYRTLSNMIGVLICNGFSFYAVDNHVYVRIRGKDTNSGTITRDFYSDPEIEAVLKTLPFQD